jgi:oligopeptide transport system substrate-binding protein
MSRKILYLLALVGGFTLLIACATPLPTATPVPSPPSVDTLAPSMTPRASATPLPTLTPLPSATTTAVPALTATPVAGYYRHPELGFWFEYPIDWFAENTGQEMPAVLLSDNDDPVFVLAGGRALVEGTDLAEFARGLKDELGLVESVELLSDGPVTLRDGTPAWEITLGWQDEDGNAMQGRGYAAVTASNGYLVFLYARPEVIETRTQTVAAIAGSLHLEQPELFGVSRENALVLLSEQPQTLDPAVSTAGLDSIVGHVFSGLVRLNSDLQIEPDLAESWEISEDGTTYTFNLRSDALFHNGRSVTAADVKLAWERATHPSLQSPTAPLFLNDIVGVSERLAGNADEISGVQVVDDHQFVVDIDAPKPYFLAKLAQPVAFITENENVAEGDEWWRKPVGTGPFMLHRWQPDRVLVVTRNDAYYRQPTAVDDVVFLVGSSGVSAYETGLVDVANVHPRNLARVQDPNDVLSDDYVSENLLCTRRVVFDVTQPPFDDPLIRQAFALAVDRAQLAETVLFDSALPAAGFLPPAMPGYVERPLSETFDVAQAQALIAESSYGDVGAIPPLTFSSGGSNTPDPLVVALADTWQTNLGVTIETELLSPETYELQLAKRHGQLFMHDWCAPYPDPESVLDIPFHSQSAANFGGYTNAEVDTLLEDARTESDSAARIALYQQAEELLLADAAAAALVFPQTHQLVRPYVGGYYPTQIPILWTADVVLDRGE